MQEMKSMKAVIFDLDGTTLDTVKTIAYYVNSTLENNGIEPIEVKQFNYLAGHGMADLIRGSLEYRNCYDDALFKKVLREYDAAYNADVTYKTTIFDGLKEVLDSIKDQEIRIAIVSNKPDVAVKTILQPLRSGAQALTSQAEGIYSYLFRYEALEEQVKALEAENAQLREEIRAAVEEVLTEQERQVIVLRYGLGGGTPQRQREVAKLTGISRSYVSRIEKRALEKLREVLE